MSARDEPDDPIQHSEPAAWAGARKAHEESVLCTLIVRLSDFQSFASATVIGLYRPKPDASGTFAAGQKPPKSVLKR